MSKEFNFFELKAAERLPSPSGTALAIMKLVQRDDATVQQVGQLIQTDPALSGRILAFANSAAFGARRPVASIQDTVVLVGISAVRNFSLSLSLIGKYSPGYCQGFDYSAYWARSLMAAVVIAGIIARDRTASPEEAFTLGLLRDIGSLALATAWPEKYSECLTQARGAQLLTLEQEQFAVDHESLTLLLLDDWGLPAIFLDALRLSRQPSIDASDTTRTARLARQLAFASQLTDYCQANDELRTRLLPKLEVEAALHALDSGSLIQLANDLFNQWQEWGKIIGINTDLRTNPNPEIAHLMDSALMGLDILLVDDDPMILARLAKQLTGSGHRVETCRDGELALKRVIEQKPQIVITDWRMKPMDGVQLCKTLRASVFAKDLYIIMLTATEDEDALVEAFDAGIDDYVVKPVSLRVLLARIRAGQRISALQQELLEDRKELERSTAELALANRRLQHLAHTDLLTALPNRRYALNRLEQEWSSVRRFNRPLSVLMLDLDYFKLVNDSLGHDIGDQVLSHAAKIMRETIRTNDVACRLGGEEFLVIASNTDSAAALLLAERIRKAVESQQIKVAALPRPVTVSIGVASSTDCKVDWKELVKLADKAVYKVKEKGRNGVHLASRTIDVV
jgi:diguanylate cyclase (GGDEF)-like protein